MADVRSGSPPSPVTEQSTAELVQKATEQVSRLIRDELALARAELTAKGRHAGIGIGLFGGGGILGLFGLGTLIAAAVLLLDLAMPAWVAALIVAVVLFIGAAVFALIGKWQVRQAGPPVPTVTADSLRADVDTITTAVKERRRD